ncbi:MAG: metallophosphoesterase [Acidimicrobiales bacterium]
MNVDGLEPDSDNVVEVRGTRLQVRTLAPPPGDELCRIATVNDLHIGSTTFGLLHRMRESPVPEVPHPLRCARAAVAEALAWGARYLVVKGDLTQKATRAQWDSVGDLLAGVPVPVAVVPGNHDVKKEREADPQPSLARHGLHLVHGVEVVDLPGVRLLLVDTTTPDQDAGHVAHLQDEVCRLLTRARGAGSPCLVAMHHHPQRHRFPTFWPPGIPGPEARRFLDAVAAANPAALITTGHTHRHRRHRHGPLTITEVGSTKDYPGTWTGYAVYEGGIRQVVRRVAEPSAIAWTQHTRRAVGGIWGWWAPGRLEDRCFSVTWPTPGKERAAPARGGT